MLDQLLRTVFSQSLNFTASAFLCPRRIHHLRPVRRNTCLKGMVIYQNSFDFTILNRSDASGICLNPTQLPCLTQKLEANPCQTQIWQPRFQLRSQDIVHDDDDLIECLGEVEEEDMLDSIEDVDEDEGATISTHLQNMFLFTF